MRGKSIRIPHLLALPLAIFIGCSGGASSSQSVSESGGSSGGEVVPAGGQGAVGGGLAGAPDLLPVSGGTGADGVGGDATGGDAASGAGATISGGTGGDVENGGTGSTTVDSSGGDAGGSTDDGVGGTGGNTDDGSGGTSGNTDDGSGGMGATDDGSGGVGATDDGSGGIGATDDNTGGVGATDDNTGGMAGTPDGPPPCLPTFMDEVNVLVFGNATPTGADVEGRMFVGGNATLPGGYSVGAALERDCDRRDLVVGGDLVFPSGGVHNGFVSVGGDYTPGTGTTFACGWEQNEDAYDFETAEAELTDYSAQLASFRPNGTTEVAYGALTFSGTDPDVNVFQVSAADFVNVTEVRLEVPESSTVVINVSGTSVELRSFGFSGGECKAGDTDECQGIIWNFYEAEDIFITGIGLQGTLLAPQADLNLENGMIDGQVIVQNLTGGGEYHPFYFIDCIELDL